MDVLTEKINNIESSLDYRSKLAQESVETPGSGSDGILVTKHEYNRCFLCLIANCVFKHSGHELLPRTSVSATSMHL